METAGGIVFIMSYWRGSKIKATAVIGSCDTKYREIVYIRERAESQGVKAMVINVAIGLDPSYGYNISREDVTKAVGKEWAELEPKTKGEKIAFIMEAVASYIEKLYKKGKTDEVLSVGGPQDMVIVTNTMKRLPTGFPEVITTTVVSGCKTFESVAGTKDTVTVPSICDFTGPSIVTRQTMENACTCCAEMIKYTGQTLKRGDRPVVGVILMGIADTGACTAIDKLERLGIETIGLHSTGVGGAIIEQMAASGLIDGILGLTTYEITQEYLKGGLSYRKGIRYRLVRGMKKRALLVVNVGGLDSIDFRVGEFPLRMDGGVHMMHNANTAHIKLFPGEAEITTARFTAWIEKIDYPVKLLVLTDGMRHNTRKSEVLYCKEMDDVIICQLKGTRNPNAETTTIPGNLDTKDWGIRAACYMVDELKECGTIGDETQY